MSETPDTIHGRLLESVHMGGYSFERAFGELKWLLEEDRWAKCGDGFERIDDFLETIDLSDFRIAAENRRQIARLLADKRATQRKIAGTLGVDAATVNRDLNPVASATPKQIQQEQVDSPNEDILGVDDVAVADATPSPVSLASDEPPKAHVANNSGEIEWYTPEEYVETARAALGGIDLDPASCEEANAVVKAVAFYSKEDDALTKDWSGRVFMNPPYSGGAMLPFCAKLLTEYASGNITAAIVLTNNATETQWFQGLLRRASALCFPSGRIRFWRTGDPAFTPLQGQALFYFGPHAKEFCRKFEGFGATAAWEANRAD